MGANWLPTIDLLVWVVDKGCWIMDRDVGDMFLNYQLHKDVSPFTALDLSCLYDDPEEAGPRWAVWDRNLMGFAALPYNSIKMALVAEEVYKGGPFPDRLGSGWEGVKSLPVEVHLAKLARHTRVQSDVSRLERYRTNVLLACLTKVRR